MYPSIQQQQQQSIPTRNHLRNLRKITNIENVFRMSDLPFPKQTKNCSKSKSKRKPVNIPTTIAVKNLQTKSAFGPDSVPS